MNAGISPLVKQAAEEADAALTPSVQACVADAVDCILAHRIHQPQMAIILGSGLGGLAADVQHASALPYATIPHFKRTHAAGHLGQLILGYVGGVPVVIMQGRYHRYEGHSTASVCFPIRVMQALGAHTLLVTNAAGGLNPRYRPGDLMVVDQHINWLWSRSAAFRSLISGTSTSEQASTVSDAETAATSQSLSTGRKPGSQVAELGSLRRLAEIYDCELSERIRKIALTQQVALHRGTYVSTLGPTYETRSEYRMFRWMGGDAVGMSTIPEVLTARELSMRVLAMSVITNVACTDSIQGTTHDEVVACGRQVEPRLRRLIGELLEQMAGPAD